jgi:5-methylcytosine-specific restriction enzyme subunit McrC
MTIPIRNLYYLLVYAYDALDEGDVIEAGALPETGLVDLFAHVLDTGVNHLLRRGLNCGYLPQREAVFKIRGCIDVSATVKTNARSGGRLVCEFDEFTADVTQNRILRATVRRLIQAQSLDCALHDRLAVLYRRLDGVTDIALSPRAFRAVQLHRGNRFYRFLLAVCRIIHDHLLADEATEESYFRDFVRDERRMRVLFERFVRNFYRREQSVFRVCRTRMPWSATGDTALLPVMNTDAILRCPERVLVVETKYTANQFQANFGCSTIRSGHLYQLFSYLANLAKRSPAGQHVEGLLLYPRASTGPDLLCKIHGHSVRVATVNLALEWPQVKQELLAFLQ